MLMTGEINPAKRVEVRRKISENTKGPRPYLVGVKKNWKPGVLEARSEWLSEMRGSGAISSPGNLDATWIPTPEQRLLPGTLYFVRYLDSSGTHFKIGITKRSLQERLGEHLVSAIHLHHATLGECFDLEQAILKWAKSNGYRYSSPTTTELIRPEAYGEVLSRLKGKTY
jgi:hypothetical protein